MQKELNLCKTEKNREYEEIPILNVGVIILYEQYEVATFESDDFHLLL